MTRLSIFSKYNGKNGITELKTDYTIYKRLSFTYLEVSMLLPQFDTFKLLQR